MPRFIQIRSSKFPILEGESKEIINPGTYGKAFALYLQSSLMARGYSSPFVCCEDWGWWVELSLPIKSMGLCCYRAHDENNECDFVCSISSEQDKVWSWKKLRFVDIGAEVDELVRVLTQVFDGDDQITLMGVFDDFPIDN